MTTLLSVVAGVLCGVISGLGIGGGSVLMLWMTLVAGISQRVAQGINLLYFLPTALCALIFHAKKGAVDFHAVLPAAIFSCLAAALTAWIATQIDVALLRRFFGAFLLLIGLRELFAKTA
ncbi:MAG: sulfite exporter TauE/SafE family protein [Oscillospiraceae bacterium]|nr:sulfite exporter TauE/SafE family protein [Oscillospiraceae bacterium]